MPLVVAHLPLHAEQLELLTQRMSLRWQPGRPDVAMQSESRTADSPFVGERLLGDAEHRFESLDTLLAGHYQHFAVRNHRDRGTRNVKRLDDIR